jgi:5-methylcytosine-specific restriction endonuclease McrA
VRCSIDEWTKQFPFWSTQTVRRIIATLERSDLLLTSIQYNEYSFDRTRWFSADYDAIIAQPVRVNRTPPYVKIPIPLELRAAILERDGFRCLHCGVQDRLSIDHIIPESRGGTMDIENLQTLCRRCNSRKGNR